MSVALSATGNNMFNPHLKNFFGTKPQRKVIKTDHNNAFGVLKKLSKFLLRDKQKLIYKMCERIDVENLDHFYKLCEKGDHETIKLLRDLSLTPEVLNYRDEHGYTGFILICQNGDIDTLKVIEQIKELDMNLADKEGNTGLHHAASSSNSDFLKRLCKESKRRLFINNGNLSAITPLMKAAVLGRTENIRILLTYANANVFIQDQAGWIAADYARRCSRFEALRALEKQMRCVAPATAEQWRQDYDARNPTLEGRRCLQCVRNIMTPFSCTCNSSTQIVPHITYTLPTILLNDEPMRRIS